MTLERLLNMSVKVLYLPKNFYTPESIFLATPLIYTTFVQISKYYINVAVFTA